MKKFVITLGRQFGSGGREVAEKLAKKMNIKYYDKEILEIASENSGYVKEVFESVDEKRRMSFSEGITTGNGASIGAFYSINDALSADNLFMHKMEAIKSIAEKESCIIVGRCADYILRDRDDLLTVFITCNQKDKRIDRVRKRHPEISEKQLEKFIRRVDKRRADYYEFYTDQTWGSATSYDLTIDTGKFGIDGTCDLIIDAINQHFHD